MVRRALHACLRRTVGFVWPEWFAPTYQSACQTAHFAWGCCFALAGMLLYITHDWPWWSGLAACVGFAAVKEYVIDLMAPEYDTLWGSTVDFFFYCLGAVVMFALSLLLGVL